MKRTLELIAAPTGLQPGGYVRTAYADRTAARTPSADVEVARPPGVWRVAVTWSCPEPVRSLGDDPQRFPDAAALAVPTTTDAPWITMGAPGKGVVGVLWRADRETLLRVTAEGLGSVARAEAPSGWSARATWKAGTWRVDFTLRDFPALDAMKQLGVAVWRGADAERGGLKSVTPGWIEVAS